MILPNSRSQSNIESQADKLGRKFIENVNYEDLDYRGFVPANRNITVRAGDALVNDMKLWLQSTQGDYYRRSTFGGPLDRVHTYPLSDQGAADLRSSILEEARVIFPSVEVKILEVTPKAAERRWIINMLVQDTITNLIGQFSSEFEASS